MRTLIAVALFCGAMFLLSCAGPCNMGEDCWVSEFNGQTVEMHGTATFTDDDRDVKSLSPGGFVRIRDGNWVNAGRVYEVRADYSGHLTRSYMVDGEPKQMNGAAQAWVAAAMLHLIRETGAGAPERVQRILRTGGPNAVLAEVGEIGSDGSKRTYLRELIEHGRLTDDQYRDAMRTARRINSDGDKADLLIEVADVYLKPNVRDAWFSTANTINSDGDKRRVLERAVRQDGSSGETLSLAARSAATINSDGDKAAVLTDIAEDYKPEARSNWFRAANSINSDGDRQHALTVLLRTGNGNPDTLVDLFTTARGINSDGDKARFLSDAAQYPIGSPVAVQAFFAAANTINSDGDHANVLAAVLRGPNHGGPILAGVAESARHINSDGDKARVLSTMADSALDTPAVRASFFDAVNSINSDGDRASVLTRVLRQPGQPQETVIAAVESAAGISSDGDKATLLVLAADTHAGNAPVRAALQKALESVHSDGDYRRVSSALIRKTT